MVHQYKNNGYDIVLDVNSGAIHVVDDVTYDVIEMYAARENVADASEEEIVTALSGKYGKEEVEEAIDEVQTLIKNEELFTKDTYENYMMDFKKRPTVVKALCLHIAHDCNLACRYCFAEEGEYHGRRALMSFETGKKALDFLIANSGNRRNLEVDFFGGEPLMNWQVVKDLVAYGREQEKIHNKNFRFTLTTNGVLLNDEIMEFANKEMGNVVLSIDGRKKVHDHMRPFRKGAGSYDLIVPKFQKFADSRNQDKYYVRGTFTHNNLDFSNDVLHLADLGFKQISVEPVVAQPTEDYAIREEDLPQLYEEYDKLAGLEGGADDYVVKPFSPRELVARVKAVLNRTMPRTEASDSTMTFGELSIDTASHTVKVSGEEVSLTPKEFDLLVFLASNKGIALSREKILQKVWNYDYFGEDRTVDTHVKMLRGHLGKCRGYIATVWGIGYKFDPDAAR